MASEIKRYFAFDGFEFDAQRLTLEYEDRLVHLPPKSLQTLKILLEHRGETVTRETLISEIWHDAFVEDSNLTVAVSTLRKSLNSFVGNIDIIQTVPREGYRFVGDVSEKIHISEQPVVVERRNVERYTLEVVESPMSSTRPVLRANLQGHKSLFYGFAAVAFLTATVAFTAFFLTGEQVVDPAPQKLAVLPFRSFEGLPDENSIGLGFADSLITKLGAFESTTVLPIGSVSGFLGTASDPAAYGRDLGADAVIEGSFIRADGRLRVNVRLIRTSDGKQIWNGTFDDDEKESLFRVHDRIAQAVSHSLGPRALPANGNGKLTQNPEAYHNYLMGNYLLRMRGWNVVKAAPYFEKAIELDPNFTQAYIGLATVHATDAKNLDKAKTALAKASQFDPDHPEIHSLNGFIEMFHNWNWNGAEQSFDRALEIDPNSVTALHWRGEYRKFRGWFEQAESDFLRALELDPLSPIIRTDLAELYYFAGNDEESIRQNEKVLAIDPSNQIANRNISRSLKRLGLHDEAFARHLEFSVAYQNFASKEDESKYRNTMTEIYRLGGRKKIERLREISHRRNAENGKDLYVRLKAKVGLSLLDIERGNHDAALDRLASVVKELNASGKPKNFILHSAAVNPDFEAVRNSPRFRQILAAMNL